jgi:signal transduction histidine kinase
MENTLNILCLEDSVDDFGLIQRELSKGLTSFKATRVETRKEFILALDNSAVDLVLSDHSLPEFNSLEALNIVRGYQKPVPFILVTGAVSEEFAVRCIKLGADDYVLKQNLSGLSHTIKSALRSREEEAEKKRMAKELESRSEELARLNRELDSFVYSVSHNLRAPMRSILGLLNISRMENDLDKIHAYHNLMEKSIQKLDKNLIEILEYSRTSRQDLKLETVDVKGIIDDAFEKIEFMNGNERIRKEIVVEQTVPFINDAYRLSVVLNNLASNAVKYQDYSKRESFIRIHVKVDSQQLFLVITDNGIGIEKKSLPEIFKMFSRATNKAEGVGLGLYIVKEAVELMKGEITVSSILTEGTSFRITIPNAPHTDLMMETRTGKAPQVF